MEKLLILLASPTQAFNRIDTAGYKFLSIIHRIGFWLCIIEALLGTLEWVMQQGSKGKRRIVCSVLGFAALYVIPWAFELIRDIFN
jgi:hypothetical protein